MQAGSRERQHLGASTLVFIIMITTLQGECSLRNGRSDSSGIDLIMIRFVIIIRVAAKQKEGRKRNGEDRGFAGLYYLAIMMASTCGKSKTKGLQSRLNCTKALYLIGDEGCDKSFIFEFLQLQQEELNHQINIYVKVFEDMTSLELYDFPCDKLVRNAMELYLKLLPQPANIVYFIKSEGTEKDIGDWMQNLKKWGVASKVIFISDVSTYMEREKILNRIGKEFQANVLDIVLFVRLEPFSFRRAFEHLADIGVSIDYANCLKPTLGRKMMSSIMKVLRKIMKKRRELFLKNAESVI